MKTVEHRHTSKGRASRHDKHSCFYCQVVDQRPTWKLNVTEPVAGNYYPVRRQTRRAAVARTRSQSPPVLKGLLAPHMVLDSEIRMAHDLNCVPPLFGARSDDSNRAFSLDILPT